MSNKKIKVLLVEDSLLIQNLLSAIITGDNRFELVAIARDGRQAADYVQKFKPDVVSMDVNMPVMDGIESTKYIMENCPLPIVVVSSFSQSTEVELTMRALDAGAATIVQKPFGPGHAKYEQSARLYLNTLKLMSEIKVVRRKARNTSPQPAAETAQMPAAKSFRNRNIEYKIVAIGASAGGPVNLRSILSSLAPDLSVPVVIVQHIDANFAEGFAAWLNQMSNLPVHLVHHETTMKPGHVYMASGDMLLKVCANNAVTVAKNENSRGTVGSVNYLFESVAEVYGKHSIAILLSGMGRDGASEMKRLYDMGAYTIAQDETSSLIFGMPGEALKLGAVREILTPANMVNRINELLDNKEGL